MAISIVSNASALNGVNGAAITLSMPTGLQQFDVVYVILINSSNLGGGTSSGGWTQIGSTVDNGVRLQIFRKVMGASPDTSIGLNGTGNAADSSVGLAVGFRGVDTILPEDGVAPTTATGTSTNPDCPSITPKTSGDMAIAFAGTRLDDVVGTTAPSGYINFFQGSSIDTNSCSAYLSTKAPLTGGGAEDPGAYGGVSSAAWAAMTVVVRALGSLAIANPIPPLPLLVR